MTIPSDRYQILEQIGKGGLGIVYRAMDTQLNREVAIKRVRVDTEEPIEELTANLVEEAKTLSALNHPNIVTVHDVGHDAEGPFVVMELLNGDTLDDVIEKAPLPMPDFERLVQQTLDGMIAAQSVNLLHRDLKPANIMLTWLPGGTFQTKILDFGLAKFSPKPTTQTMDHSDSILGSIYFMAPEQFERKPLDARTDLYSLGAIFYYSLAGRYPFDGEHVVEVMTSHMNHIMTPLQEYRPDVPTPVCRWIERLMAREMDDRPANAAEALAEWNPEPVVDEKQLRDAAGGDPEMVLVLLDEFLGEMPELLDQLGRALDEVQCAEIEEVARTIRGTASTLGYTGVIAIAKQIEENAATDPTRCRKLSEGFPAALRQLEETVRNGELKSG
ncbi:MAG: protein kinase [Verrucomicrobiales bacterium]|nr:protein kinase [Verrucomicrobiales bacterium]